MTGFNGPNKNTVDNTHVDIFPVLGPACLEETQLYDCFFISRHLISWLNRITKATRQEARGGTMVLKITRNGKLAFIIKCVVLCVKSDLVRRTTQVSRHDGVAA